MMGPSMLVAPGISRADIVAPVTATAPAGIEGVLSVGPYGPATMGSTVYIKDGKFESSTGLTPYVSGFLQAIKGPLRQRNGSPMPPTMVLSDSERAARNEQPSGIALDAIAAVFGKNFAFEKLASSPPFFEPAQVKWWGSCLPWSWTATHQLLNELVTVDAPEGQQGSSFAGQWLSEADARNWLMGLANGFDKIANLEPGASVDGSPNAVSILRAAILMSKGHGGVIMDVHNDAREKSHATWNQPYFAVKGEVETITGPGADGIKKLAEQDGWNATSVKRAHVIGSYAKEVGDAYEGPTFVKTSDWNAYVITNREGAAVWGYMADDPRLTDLDLPVKVSDSVPEYMAQLPLSILDEALSGEPAAVFDRVPHGEAFRFYVGTVLKHAVPGPVRSAFEAEIASLPAGPISSDVAAALAAKFSKVTVGSRQVSVANAYSPAEWVKHFGSRGLDASAFSAIWAGR